MSKGSNNKSYTKDNSKKVTFYLENDIDDLLNAVVFLTPNESKVHLLNEATKFFLEKLIKEKGLKEKIEMILK